MNELDILTRARELADVALIVLFDGRLALRAPGYNDVQLGLQNCDRDPLFISLAALLGQAMSEVPPPPARSPADATAAEGQTQCEATFRAVGHTYRCELAAGHPGRHADGGLWWPDPGETATARLAQLRQESFDQGREQGLGEAHELVVQVAEGLTKAEGDDVDAEVVSRIVVALMRTAGALRDKSTG